MNAVQQAGPPEGPMTAVLLRGGGLRLYQHCPKAEEWPLETVIRESGGVAGYRVTGWAAGAGVGTAAGSRAGAIVEARRAQSPRRLVLGAAPATCSPEVYSPGTDPHPNVILARR